jgi:hypothetical protein
MAELSDWLKRKILVLQKLDSSREDVTGVFRVIFQKLEDGNHSFGMNVPYADITCIDFRFDPTEIQKFIREANAWLALPIHEMAVTHFDGVWQFGHLETNHLTLLIGPYASTPTKTDWMNVYVRMKANKLFWDSEFHIDQTCLSEFVNALSSDWLN